MRLRAGQRLFLSYLVLSVVTVVALTFGIGASLRRHLTEQTRDALWREARLAVAFYDAHAGSEPDAVARHVGKALGRRVTVIRRDGTVIGDSEVAPGRLTLLENHGTRPEVRAALGGRVGEAVRVSRSVGEPQLYVAMLTGRGEVLRVAVALGAIYAAIGQVQRGLLGVGLAALVFGAALSLGLSYAVTRPLHKVGRVARAMAAGDLSRRVHARGGDEIGEVADALDTLADELQRRLVQLEGERGEMQALIDAMAEGVLALDRDGTVRRANPAARRMFGLVGEARGTATPAVSRQPAFLELVGTVLKGTPLPATELVHGQHHLLASAQPLADGGAVLVFLDVSPLRRLQDVRRDFVANASHELKTPLTAIRGYSETLLDPELPPDLRQQFTETVHANAERLQHIVDDLLDLSRIESGGWRAEPEPVVIEQVARAAWNGFSAAAEEQRVRFEIQADAPCDQVLADPSALHQIFANLFSNALRFTPSGGSITVLASPAPKHPGWTRVEVRDTGTGIPAVHLPRIFERFYRVDPARSRAEGGTGLGLAIVRHLVEAHGGSVEAESSLGQGTTIRFTLPSHPATHPVT